MVEDAEFELALAERVRERHRELQAFVPRLPELAGPVNGQGKARSLAGPRVRSTGVLGATAMLLVGIIVVVSVRWAQTNSAGLPAQASPAASAVPSGAIDPVALAVLGTQRLIVAGSSRSDPAHGAIAISEDGGATWHARDLAAPPINGVAAYGETMLLTADCSNAKGPDCVWRSLDGGATFSALTAVPRLNLPWLVDERRGRVIARQEYPGVTVWETRDAGATWAQTSPSCSGWVVAIAHAASVDAHWTLCADPDGQATREGWTREIVKSNWDGSETELMASVGARGVTGSLPTEGTLMGLSMTADGYGWLWTNDNLYATSDEGRNWAPVASQSVVAAGVVNHTDGFAILSDGASRWVAATVDGGLSWSPRPIP
jgi:photosystem II stability/assembly factor-like uncharacterized protein